MRRGPGVLHGAGIMGGQMMIAPVKVQRLRANESGLSRFDTFEIEREMTMFAPPTHPFPVSASTPASRFVVLQLPAGWSGERHRTPNRPVLFCLAGSVGVTPGVGDAVTISVGGCLAHGGHDRKRPYNGGRLSGPI